MSTRPPHHYEGLNKKFTKSRKKSKRKAAQTRKSLREYMLPDSKESLNMSTPAQKAFFASLAILSRKFADVVDEMASEETAVPAKAEKPATKVKAETPKVETKSATEPAKPAVVAQNGAGDLMAQCRSAAKSYAEVYGRDGLKEQIQKFTTGTLADVPADKLPELLKVLG